MYVKYGDLLIPIGSLEYMDLVSKGLINNVNSIQDTGGNIIFFSIGTVLLVIVLSFICALFASQYVKSKKIIA